MNTDLNLRQKSVVEKIASVYFLLHKNPLKDVTLPKILIGKALLYSMTILVTVKMNRLQFH